MLAISSSQLFPLPPSSHALRAASSSFGDDFDSSAIRRSGSCASFCFIFLAAEPFIASAAERSERSTGWSIEAMRAPSATSCFPFMSAENSLRRSSGIDAITRPANNGSLAFNFHIDSGPSCFAIAWIRSGSPSAAASASCVWATLTGSLLSPDIAIDSSRSVNVRSSSSKTVVLFVPDVWSRIRFRMTSISSGERGPRIAAILSAFSESSRSEPRVTFRILSAHPAALSSRSARLSGLIAARLLVVMSRLSLMRSSASSLP